MSKELTFLSLLWERTTEFVEIKAVAAVFIAVGSFLYDPTQVTALFAVFLLIVIDCIFGIIAAKSKGIQITSAKFYHTPLKIVIYFILISACHMTEYALPHVLGFLDETLTGWLAATELLSILESAGYAGYQLPRKLLNQLQEYTDGASNLSQQ